MDPVLLERLFESSQRHPMPTRFPPMEELGLWLDFVNRAIRHHQNAFNVAVRFGPRTLGRNTVRQVSMATMRHLQNVRNTIKTEMFKRAIQGQQQFLNFHIRHEFAGPNSNHPNVIKYWSNLQKVYDMSLERAELELKRIGHLIDYWQDVKRNTPMIREDANRMIGQYRQVLSEVTRRRNNAARRRAGKSFVLGKRNISGRLK